MFSVARRLSYLECSWNAYFSSTAYYKTRLENTRISRLSSTFLFTNKGQQHFFSTDRNFFVDQKTKKNCKVSSSFPFLSKETKPVINESLTTQVRNLPLCPLKLLQAIKALPLFEYFGEQSNPVLNQYVSSICNISSLPQKVKHLKNVLATGDWHCSYLNELFPCEHSPRIYNIPKMGFWNYVTPFVALYALTTGDIDEAQFVQVQTYFSLRLQFSQKEIEIVKPPALCKANEDSNRWQTLLEKSLIRYPVYKFIRLSEKIYHQNISSLLENYKANPGGLVYFSIQKHYHHLDEDTMLFRLRDLDFMPFCWRREEDDRGLNIGNIAGPLVLYQTLLKMIFPKSYVILRPRVGLTPIEKQKHRKGKDRQRGSCDVLIPFPGKFEVKLDGLLAPGWEGIFHDIYHAFLVSMVPHRIRNFAIDYADKLLVDKQAAQKALNERQWFQFFPVSSNIEDKKSLIRFRNEVYEMEVMGLHFSFFYSNAKKVVVNEKKAMQSLVSNLTQDPYFDNKWNFLYFALFIAPTAPWNMK